MNFKDKIISFILFFIATMMLIAIGIFGYIIYKEIVDMPIETGISEQITYPNLENTNKQEEPNSEGNIFPENSQPNTTTEKLQSRYLYNQLDSTAKTIYDKIYNSKENMKTGTYTIEFGNTFSEILSKENGEEELQKQYQSAIEALMYENPDLFFINATKMYINIETITKLLSVTYNVYINSGEYGNYLADGLTCKEDVEIYEVKIEEAKNNILTLAQGKDNYEKIKTIHNYLVENIEYETTISQPNIYNIYGALVSKRCVCEGYAKSFQLLMNEIGIQNVMVIGRATNDDNQTENHAWNYVQLDGNWYAVDVTWDDPIVVGGGFLPQMSKYKYFLKGSKTINKNHIIMGNFTEGGMTFKYPELSVEDYKK